MTFDRIKFESVCQHAREAMVWHTIADTLEWDERTGMPLGGGEYRAQQVSTVRSRAHELRTDARYGDELESLSQSLDGLDPHGHEAATVRELHHEFGRDSKLPGDLVRELSLATVRGQQAWDAAKKSDDYGAFKLPLQTMLNLKRQQAARYQEGSDQTLYEGLLDEFEPGASEAHLDSVFTSLRNRLVPFIELTQGVANGPNVACLQGPFEKDPQRRLSRFVCESIGFDFDRGRIDETSHPFCTTLGPSDIRILSRYETDWLASGLYGALHEAGHGLYEQGLDPDWFGLPPGSFASLGVHESQSRLWENQVGRSRPFWVWLLSDAKKIVGSSLAAATVDEVHCATNAVRPSLIRVEADEATYNLHVIIRFDLERQLIHGDLSVDDLPEAWNARYESDLGIRPSSDSEGVLQDVHWSAGLFGYFPTYTLGNLIGAQLFAA
ncbi:MAG: carboxypeptidase M32, partial [Planctomycetota bacterium]